VPTACKQIQITPIFEDVYVKDKGKNAYYCEHPSLWIKSYLKEMVFIAFAQKPDAPEHDIPEHFI
jgi:hypothetical protein